MGRRRGTHPSMRVARSVVVAMVLTAVVGPAAAEPVAEPTTPTRKGQISGFLQLGTGYRGIFPFDEEYCGEDDPDKKYCLGRSPFGLDVGAGYGVLAGLDVIVTLTIGLERDFGARRGSDGPRPLALAPGVRLRLADFGTGIFWSTLELPIDLTTYDQADRVDLGVRNRNGIEFPVARHVALYGFFGETATWRRWFRFEVEAGLGVTVRR
jgi:hypothetical protein